MISFNNWLSRGTHKLCLIIFLIRPLLIQYLSLDRLETNKLEFKRQWYNLRETSGKHEFLKDATAIVNSYGGDDGFIICGVDEKTKELFNSDLCDSGFKDQSSICKIIFSFCEP
jgi:predicted HTH transcriptional regulator